MNSNKQQYLILRVFMVVFVLVCFHGAFAMNVKVALPTGQTVPVEAQPEDTVAKVKDFVYNVTEIHPGNQRMFKGNVEMENMKTLASYGVADGDTLYVKHGTTEPFVEKKGSGGFLKIVVIVIVLAGIAYWIKRKVFTNPEE